MPNEERFKKSDRPAPRVPLANRPLHFIWIIDCSGSMAGKKIGTVNHAISEVVPEMKDAAQKNANIKLLVRTMQFSTGASWVTPEWIGIEDFFWQPLIAEDGVTDLGAAFDLLAKELDMPPMPKRAMPPVIVLVSDGLPTDDYRSSLDKLKELPWMKKAVRIAIGIGHADEDDYDRDVLEEFTNNKELVLEAPNATTLVKMIKWASTSVVGVAKPASQQKIEQNPTDDKSRAEAAGLNMNNIPEVEDDDDVWEL